MNKSSKILISLMVILIIVLPLMIYVGAEDVEAENGGETQGNGGQLVRRLRRLLTAFKIKQEQQKQE